MNITEISTDQEFKKIIGKKVALIDFNAPWCSPCRSQEPIMESLAVKFNGRAAIASINIDRHQQIALSLDIKNIPTLIIFNKGTELQRFVGLQPESTLFDAIERALV
jgi:thioredoxin 1